MLNKVMNFLRDEEGASAVEYALIAGLIAVVLVVAIGTLNGGFTKVFGDIATTLKSPPAAAE